MNKDETTKFELSLSQKNIWDLEQSYDGTSINNISTTIRINGRINITLLQKTLDIIVSKDSPLRTRISLDNGVPLQYIAPYTKEEFLVYDFSASGENGLATWEMTVAREALPILDSPLYRFVIFKLSEKSGGVYLKIHHLISDGWSQALICNHISKIYFNLLKGKEIEDIEFPCYKLYIQDEQNYLASRQYQKDKVYWIHKVRDFDSISSIKEFSGATLSPVGKRLSYKLSKQLNNLIFSFCMEHRVSPFNVFYMALAIYFKRLRNNGNFTIGVPILNRSNHTFKQCTGMFVSTLPFINAINEDLSLSEFNESFAEDWYELLKHQRFPFKEITTLANQPDGKLFKVALSYQNSKIYESTDTSVMFTGKWHYSGYQAEQLCVHLNNLESIREYAVDYDYLIQVFSAKEIEILHENLINILTNALNNPKQPIGCLSMLSHEIKEKVIYQFNDNSTYIPNTGLYYVFRKVANSNLSRVAIIHEGVRYTYDELKSLAKKYSNVISSYDLPKNELIAILLPRSVDLYAAMVGALRAGCAYLLISPNTPKKELQVL